MGTNELTVTERATAPTSKFFKRLCTIGLCLAAVGGAILAAPVSIPAAIVTAAGYVAVAGGVMTSVAQLSVKGE